MGNRPARRRMAQPNHKRPGNRQPRPVPLGAPKEQPALDPVVETPSALHVAVLSILFGLWRIGCIVAASLGATLIWGAVFTLNVPRRRTGIIAGMALGVVVQQNAYQVWKGELPGKSAAQAARPPWPPPWNWKRASLWSGSSRTGSPSRYGGAGPARTPGKVAMNIVVHTFFARTKAAARSASARP